MSLASWLDDVNKRHANTVYASKEIDKEFQKIRRRRSKSLGSTTDIPPARSPKKTDLCLDIPQSNFNRRSNTARKWESSSGMATPTTPRKALAQTQPSTPTSSWTSNRVVGATLKGVNRAIPSPKERGIPLSPTSSSRRVEYPGFGESVKKLDFGGQRRRNSPIVNHYEKDVFGALLPGGNKENIPPGSEYPQLSPSLGASLGISVENNPEVSEKGPKMRPKEPNVLKRWQPINASANTPRERKISPSLRQLKTRSMPTFPPSVSSLRNTQSTNSSRSSLILSTNDNIGRSPNGKLGDNSTTNTFTSFTSILNDIDHAHDNNKDINTSNKDTNKHIHHRSLSTPSIVVDNEVEGESEAGDISQSSLIELDVDHETVAPQFDLAATPRSDIFSNNIQLFPEVVAPKPIHVHIGNPLGRIEEEANVAHRPLPTQPINRSPNRHRPLPSPMLSPSMQPKSPLMTPPLSTPRHAALPAPPSGVDVFAEAANNNANALKPKRIYKPALNKNHTAPSFISQRKLNAPNVSYAATPPPAKK
ncbi:hypothetical protein E3Q17_02747 [Wallemia mellicola]|uniref:Uncharacterized protein n=1 Tax=Wallemia mellicola TaxID=1708541 RepID=A0A4T0NRQ0_9BASI|nr:hypothetical protein E3Q17_02747 [Wallemia mellicola]